MQPTGREPVETELKESIHQPSCSSCPLSPVAAPNPPPSKSNGSQKMRDPVDVVGRITVSPTVATAQQLEGRRRLADSKGFDEYVKELRVGLALPKIGAMAKPDCIVSCDGQNLTIKTESTLKTIQLSCALGEKFEETTADGRKTQTVCNFTDGALVHHQGWDGKESTVTRKLKDGKLVVDCIMNDITCTRVDEKVE
ncbi:fatty acid-binding protein 5-like [Cynocephalus volans]|uniref:fatty acid-binding protein 5-like n=1 Tax=Cynocephalus volans TaxID=110931 RepID=UPI002FC920C6